MVYLCYVLAYENILARQITIKTNYRYSDVSVFVETSCTLNIISVFTDTVSKIALVCKPMKSCAAAFTLTSSHYSMW